MARTRHLDRLDQISKRYPAAAWCTAGGNSFLFSPERTAMKYSLMLGIALSAGCSQAARAQALPGDAVVQDQWFTGTLEAPSPALPKAGLLVVKPFAIFTRIDGTYDSTGSYRSASGSDTVKSVILVKYGVTDRLSIQLLPALAHVDGGNTHSSGIGAPPDRSRISPQQRKRPNRLSVCNARGGGQSSDRQI